MPDKTAKVTAPVPKINLDKVDPALLPARPEVRPEGYPELGLTPQQPLLWSMSATAEAARNYVEKFEHACGNALFKAANLEKINTPTAHELANVYVALRQAHPSVRPDMINFAGLRMDDPLSYGQAWAYHVEFPQARGALSNAHTPVAVEDQISYLRSWSRSVRNLNEEAAGLLDAEIEQALHLRVIDLTRSGMLRIWSGCSTPRRVVSTLKHRTQENLSDDSRGKYLTNMPTLTSWSTYVFIHEFGHLADAAVWEANRSASVYGPLSKALLGIRPDQSQWGHHLANYPVAYNISHPGPAAGGKARARKVRASLAPTLKAELGPYAAFNRDEMFAEAFAASYVAYSDDLRRRLATFQRSIQRACA